MIRLKEVVPFNQADTIEKGIRKRYRDFDEGTFGLDIEFHTNDPDDGNIDPYEWLDDYVHEVSRDSRAMDEYYEWLDDQRISENRRYRGDNWDDSHGPVDADNWARYNDSPERDAFAEGEEGTAEFEEARDNWLSERNQVEKTHHYWEQRDREDYVEEWFREKIDDGTWTEYVDASYGEPQLQDSALTDVDQFIEELTGQPGSKSGWDVGDDGSDIMEIRTPPMTYDSKNLDLLGKVMDYCYKNYYAKGDTSAHVHIGMAKDSTIFDLLAATTLVDEKAIEKDISNDRELEQFASLSDTVHRKIIVAIDKFLHQREMEISQMAGKSLMVPNEQLKSYMKNEISRYSGTNIQSFFKHQTLEFRYFSSQIAPQFGKFEQWIKYFMLIAKIASSRNQFIIGKGNPHPLVFTREGKAQVKITILDERGKMPKSPGMPSAHLRSQQPDPDLETRKALSKVKRQIRDPDQRELDFSTLP